MVCDTLLIFGGRWAPCAIGLAFGRNGNVGEAKPELLVLDNVLNRSKVSWRQGYNQDSTGIPFHDDCPLSIPSKLDFWAAENMPSAIQPEWHTSFDIGPERA